MSARTNGAMTGALGGAAQGASTGFMIGGPWGAAAGAGLGLIGGYFAGKSRDRQFENQQAWARYNASMQYNADMFNIEAGLGIAKFNAMATMAAARAQAAAATQAAEYNALIINATTNYNVALAKQDLDRIWEAADLDITQVNAERAREAGALLGTQAASGTIIDEGTNKEVMISQEAQRQLDVFVINRNAERQAADIQNGMAQSRWQGQVAISQTMWEGQVQASVTMANAAAQAISGLGTAHVQGIADKWSAEQRHLSAMYGMENALWSYNEQNVQNMWSGMFQAAGTGAQAYYANKNFPTTYNPGSGSSTPSYISAPGTANYIPPRQSVVQRYGGSGSSLVSGR